MSYYYEKTVSGNFEDVVNRVTAALKTEGFGVLTDIDIRKTLKKKLGVEFRSYRILGACNPRMAHTALQIEDKIGVLLPCSVVVQEKEARNIEVAIMNPGQVMSAVRNDRLQPLAEKVTEKLKRVLEKL